jgi:hypothetical protein
MKPAGHASEWVDALDQAAVAATDAVAREGLGVAPPTVHVLVDGLDPAYVGHLGCRPFYRGRDAHAAVAVMGLFGSMLDAARLVICYEHADMARAWQDPAADSAPTGVVVIDAARHAEREPDGGHTIRWHPLRFTNPAAPTPSGVSPRPVRVQWGPSARHPGGRLPAAVAQLLAVWREPRRWDDDREFLRVMVGWEQGGYALRWVQRPGDEHHQPRWMRLLAPIM